PGTLRLSQSCRGTPARPQRGRRRHRARRPGSPAGRRRARLRRSLTNSAFFRDPEECASMKLATRLLASVLLAVPLATAHAAESGSFLVRLGQDTTSVEHYTRDANRIEITQVGRAPRTLQRHIVYDLKGNSVTHVSLTATPPGSATP